MGISMVMKSHAYLARQAETENDNQASPRSRFDSANLASCCFPICLNSITVKITAITIKPNTTTPVIRSVRSFIVPGSHYHEFEIYAKTQNGRNPDSREDALHALTTEPQVPRYKKRDHYGQKKKEVGFFKHICVLKLQFK
jgi:hypothetical protein